MNAARQLPSILLIDDDAISREVMQMTLEMHGLTIATAANGAEALRLIQEFPVPPSLILMDTRMPGLSGVELVRALRALSQARIVAISASEPGREIRQAADGFLLKPIEPEAVLALLNASADAPPGQSDRPATSAASATRLETVQAAAGDEPADLPALIDPVDAAVLAKFRAMMPASAVREIYAATATDLDTRLTTLQTAMEGGDGAEVARIAHAIKGGCAMVGLTGARDAAARLESINRPVTWSNELAQLHFALSGLKGMLGVDFPA